MSFFCSLENSPLKLISYLLPRGLGIMSRALHLHQFCLFGKSLWRKYRILRIQNSSFNYACL